MIDAGTGPTVRALQKKHPRDRHIIIWWAFGHADPAAAGRLGGHLHGLGIVVDAHVDVHAHLELEVLEAARELGLVDACESDR